MLTWPGGAAPMKVVKLPQTGACACPMPPGAPIDHLAQLVRLVWLKGGCSTCLYIFVLGWASNTLTRATLSYAQESATTSQSALLLLSRVPFTREMVCDSLPSAVMMALAVFLSMVVLLRVTLLCTRCSRELTSCGAPQAPRRTNISLLVQEG